MATKLRLFIGSSVEALEYASAIQENLEHDADCTVWPQGVFGLNRTTFPDLLEKMGSFDCAVFVFAPDDKLILRGEQKLAVRDNVLFELGLFCGRFGNGRVFVAAPYDIKNIRLPTDLLGVYFAGFQAKRSDGNITAALGTACSQIRRELKKLTPVAAKKIPEILRSGWFSEYATVFPQLLSKAKNVTLYFIHSRRWRENHNTQIREFLKRPRTRLKVFLPDRQNKALIKAIQAHFNDGPAIPGFINDAFDYFEILRKEFPKKVSVGCYDTYPTYSFYKFDDEFIVAAYPTTPLRRDIPTFHLNASHPYAQFILVDLAKLLNK